MTRIITLAAPLALSLAVAACGHPKEAYDYQARHPITVETRLDSAVLTLDDGVSAEEKAKLMKLAAAYGRNPVEGPIEILLGPGAASEDITDALIQAGLEAKSIVTRQAGAGELPPGVAVASYPYAVAKVPECGQWDRPVGSDSASRPTDNFGCAIQRNKGLMLADPRDLERARDVTPRDANRSVDVIGKYRKGLDSKSAGAIDAKVSATGAGGGQ